MSTHTSPTLIGTFVAGAIGLIVAGILIISGGKLLLTDKSSYVLYFHGSVKGLNIGSPVSFRGVNIGTVTDIQLVVGEKESDIHIPVIIEIDNTKFLSSQTGKPRMDDDDSINDLVQAGMRAQLQLQSLLTGQLTHEEIPTIPTPIEKIGKLLEDIPIDKVVDQILASIEGVDRLVNSEDLHASLRALREALTEYWMTRALPCARPAPHSMASAAHWKVSAIHWDRRKQRCSLPTPCSRMRRSCPHWTTR
jgi:paraquat-inducible protein B